MIPKKDLVSCVKDLYYAGLTTSVSGNHSILAGDWIWITPSGVPRYSMTTRDLVKVNLSTGASVGSRKPSIEVGMHRAIYRACPQIRSIVHTHSPYTIAVSIAAKFTQVIEEAAIVVGVPAIISNRPSGSVELAESVAREFNSGARAVIVKNHGVVAGASSIHQARAIVESLEEWAKILAIGKIFGGPKDFLDED